MNKTFIIAEAGINHNGNFDEAKQLIEIAANAKVDAVKFQAWSKGRFPEIEHLRLTKDQLWYLRSYTLGVGPEWMCTAFDSGSIDFLNDLEMKRWKIPSGMVTNIPYLEKIRSIGPEQIILSTGMADLNEIDQALSILEAHAWTFRTEDYQYDINNVPPHPFDIGYDLPIKIVNEKIRVLDEKIDPKIKTTILHCVTAYPTHATEVNLKCLETLRSKFHLFVGLSDHSGLIEIPIAAVAMGAAVIEVHITLDRNHEGPDHKSSYEPDDLISMVNMIRNIELAMGDGIKKPAEPEMKIRDAIRKKMKGE